MENKKIDKKFTVKGNIDFDINIEEEGMSFAYKSTPESELIAFDEIYKKLQMFSEFVNKFDQKGNYPATATWRNKVKGSLEVIEKLFQVQGDSVYEMHKAEYLKNKFDDAQIVEDKPKRKKKAASK